MNNPERAQLDNLHQQGILDDDSYAAALARLEGSGSIAQGDGSVAAGERAVAVGGDLENSTVVFAEPGATVVIGEQPVAMKMDRESALGRYLICLESSLASHVTSIIEV